jgi:hypothetical protein
MTAHILPLSLLLLLGLGCTANPGETGPGTDDDCSCGDPDGNGTDTGDIPDLWGQWTTTFAYERMYDTCGDIEDLDEDSETWINNSAMNVGGYSPDGFYATFDDNEDDRYYGIVSQHGGVSFSGSHLRRDGYMAYVGFGGLAYHNEHLGRDVIEGFLYMGLDLNGDASIDCDVRGAFTARKSGS